MSVFRLLILISLIAGIYFLNLLSPFQLAAQTSSIKPLDLVLIIDHSGSMVNPRYGRSDPNQMRFLAARLLIDLLNEEDRVGLVLFSTDAQDMSNGLQLLQTGRDQLKARIVDMEQQPTGEQTSYRKALQVAGNFLDAVSSNRQPAVIFLTDGAPTDLKDREDYEEVLQPFINKQIPVYLLMLEPKEFRSNAERNDTLNRINNTLRVFRDLQQPVIEISDPASIARAFAKVITELQPGVYIDVENPRGKPDRSQTVFSASVAATQRLTEATFVFYPTRGDRGQNLAMINVRAPNNLQQAVSNNGGRYITARYKASGSIIEGEWQFTVNAPADSMSAFTFFRSDVQIRPRYPSSNKPAAPRDQAILLGAAIDGLSSDQIANIRLRINPNRCPLEQREQADDSVLAVERGIDNVVWSQFSDPKPEADHIYVIVEYAPPSALTIWKCFAVKLLDSAPKVAITSMPADLEADGSFTITAELPENVERAYAFITGPNGFEKVVPFEQGRANSGRIPAPGEYSVRVIAEMPHEEFNLALTDQRTQKFFSTIRLNSDESQTSFVVEEMNQLLKGLIVLDAPLVSSADEIRFQIGEILQNNQPANIPLNIDLCLDGIVLTNEQVRCQFQVTWPPTTQPGRYVIKVNVASDAHNVLFESIILDFTVPAPGINMRVPGGTLQLDAPITRLDPTATTNELEVRGFYIDRLPDLKFAVETLRDTHLNKTYPPSLVNLTPSRTFGEGLTARYRFDVSFDEELPPGHYEIQVRLSTDSPIDINQPIVTITGIKRSAAVRLAVAADLMTDSKQLAIWGFWLPFWQPTVTIPLTATVFFDNQIPANYPPPTVRSIQHDNDRYPRDTFTTSWKDEERVDNDRFIKTVELRLNRWLFFEGGIYDVVLESNAAFDPDNISQPLSVQVQVYGWGAYLWRGMVPAITIWAFLYFLWGLLPLKHGKILDGDREVKEGQGIKIVPLPCRRIEVREGKSSFILKLGREKGVGYRSVKYAHKQPTWVRTLQLTILMLLLSIGSIMVELHSLFWSAMGLALLLLLVCELWYRKFQKSRKSS